MLNQAQYFFIQKMFANISKASEEVAKKNDLKMLLNKEVIFYYAEDDMDQTNKVIAEMDAMFAKEQAVSENTEEKPADTEKKEEIAK